MKTGAERKAWLDYVRFFSIFLVIVFHTPPRLALFDDAVILNLRVPVFFCISGFLYNINKYSGFKHYVLHRGRQILVPYTTFFIVFYALWLVVGRKMVGPEEQSIDACRPLFEFFFGDPRIVLAPFWYIACLFTMQMIYYWIERLVPRKWVMPVCLLLACLVYFAPWQWQVNACGHTYRVMRFWNLGNALLFMPFYALGNNCKEWLERLEFKTPSRTVLLLLMAAASMLLMVWAAPVEQWEATIYRLIRIVAGMMVIPAYMCVAKCVANRYGHRRVIEFVVVSGTVYLGLQNYFIEMFRMVLVHFTHESMDEHIWLKFVVAVLVMIAIYPFAWLIDRYIPWFLGKRHSHLKKE
ncbi:MAG: acyltransferase family protein [Muribaculaceae bacterium]|nr:acyltransferase family protein [Muribaculaceae bacterium]MBQ5467106.1 acyltransferase family protein [Muribaculaceae bacterium]